MKLRSFAPAIGIVLAGASQASIVSVSGQGNILATGPAVGYKANFFQDPSTNLKIHGWDEVQNTTLDRNVVVDIDTPGTYNSAGMLGTFTIGIGTRVSSHTLYFDPAQSGTASATFTFDAKVIGIIVDEKSTAASDRFMLSDFLIPGSVPAGNIPTTHFDARGLELNPDSIVLSADRMQVTLNSTASDPGDQVRIITEAVPEPGTLAASAIGLVALCVRRRRQK